jgi:hypothetical protein
MESIEYEIGPKDRGIPRLQNRSHCPSGGVKFSEETKPWLCRPLSLRQGTLSFHTLNCPIPAPLLRLALVTVFISALVGCGKSGANLSGDWQASGKHMFGTYGLQLTLEPNGKCRALIDYVTKPGPISLASVQQIELNGTWKEAGSGIAVDMRVVKWQKTADGETEQVEFQNSGWQDGFALTDDGRLIRAWLNFEQKPDGDGIDKGETIMLNAVELRRVP